MISLMEFVSICGVATVTAAGASQGLHLLRRSRGRPTDHAVSPDDESSGRPAAGAWHEPRFGKRHSVSCRIEYLVGTSRYEGFLVDMSQRGWRAQGVHAVTKGTTLTVKILSSDLPQFITIDEAIVRWTDGPEFGVEVTRISPDAAAKLSEYLTSHSPPETPAPAYVLSPFSYN